MIEFLDTVALILNWIYAFVFFWIFHTFLPLRKNWIVGILALFLSCSLSLCIIYSNDLVNLLGVLLGFAAYSVIFCRARWIEKLTAVLVFYPVIVAVNYLMQDIGSSLFFAFTGAPVGPELGWTQQQLLISTLFYSISVLLRLLFWIGVWFFLRKYLQQITENLTIGMWLVVDALMLASFVAIFTIIYFMPENPAIVYPISVASIFSSFGCIYLVSYICNATRREYYAQELEMQQAYYKDRMEEEERVRRIYHDMKNHLLVLQAQHNGSKEINHSVKALGEQIAEYENYYHTGNDFLDIIIRDKSREARKKQIDFNVVIHFEDGCFMEPLDISSIFGNALDNALEASEKLPQDKRMIAVKSSRVRDMQLITVENSTPLGRFYRGQSTKEDDFLHGFGLTNIQKSVEKYEGQCSIKTKDELFTLRIMIPIPCN